jgi:phage terminase large subunit-like protein
LNDQGDVVEIIADPYQMHRSISTLQAAGLPIREFPQTQVNCTLMGQTLFDLLTGQNLVIYPSDELRQQALSTVAVENPRGWRIAKEKASKKIDAVVAAAMACVAAMAHRSEIGSRSARLQSGDTCFAEKQRGSKPLLIGQTLVDVPATVITQQSGDGSIRVLFAAASEAWGCASC